MFSGPIVNYDRPSVTRATRRDVTKYTFTSSTGKAFKKKEYYNPFGDLNNKVLLQRNRQIRYTDFDQMEYVPEIASALDIYADEITTSTVFNPLVNIECHNREIKDILQTLLYTVLNVDANMFSWARSMCKYGDYYLYLDIDDEMGITNVIPLPVREIERIEGTDPTNPNYIQYFWQQAEGRGKGVTFENWQVSHFRVMGSDRYIPYGTSVLEPSRRIWRQLTLLEDAMMAYRIVRSPERRVFYIDVGNIAVEDVEQYIEQVKTQMKRNQIVSEEEGRVDLRYNAMSVDEDYYIPVRGAANNTRIETLAGGQFTGDIDDVNYLRDKLFSALKVP
ncbi:MAG: portal protein, partial [Verrucomicrobiota bacterium]|nr:portal protein [Verrucomicrobiota bacterium]